MILSDSILDYTYVCQQLQLVNDLPNKRMWHGLSLTMVCSNGNLRFSLNYVVPCNYSEILYFRCARSNCVTIEGA